MKRVVALGCLVVIFIVSSSFWGFYGHQQINRLAVFILPAEMIGFYKKNILYITEASVNPDRRRFAVVEEAPRHYIDVDHYGDSAFSKLPHFWSQAVERYTEDTLKAYGILPWHIQRMYGRLKDAMLVRDPEAILRLSAELGHYIGDAHVPLHTTENYNGQRTGQDGIHVFWESRLPEMFAGDYDFFVGKATYIHRPQEAAWAAVRASNAVVDSVLLLEKRLSEHWGDRKYSFETKGRQTQKVIAREFAQAYHEQLRGMVERRMRAAIKMTGDFWYTAWVDAGQPDLNSLIGYTPPEDVLKKRREELEQWKQRSVPARAHEIDH